jgi:hypothetical protein
VVIRVAHHIKPVPRPTVLPYAGLARRRSTTRANASEEASFDELSDFAWAWWQSGQVERRSA